MTTEKTPVDELEEQVEVPGAAEDGDEWDNLKEKELFGEEATPPKGKASEKESESDNEIPLDVIQAHPAFADLQSKYDRQQNVVKFQGEQLTQFNEQLRQFREKQFSEIIERLGGDTPENRDVAKLITDAQEKEQQAMMVMQQFGPLLKRERAMELINEKKLPKEYVDDLASCETYAEAVQKAEVIRSVLSKIPKPPITPGGTKPGGEIKRTPALTKAPDKATHSVAPNDFPQVEQDYIDGKVDFKVYKEAARKVGIVL